MESKDSFILGLFFGALLCCWFMLVWPKPTICEVDYGDVNHTHVRYGIIVQ